MLPEYQIYITAGEGIFESTSVARRKVETGSVILLFPGEWRRYRRTSITCNCGSTGPRELLRGVIIKKL